MIYKVNDTHRRPPGLLPGGLQVVVVVPSFVCRRLPLARKFKRRKTHMSHGNGHTAPYDVTTSTGMESSTNRTDVGPNRPPLATTNGPLANPRGRVLERNLLRNPMTTGMNPTAYANILNANHTNHTTSRVHIKTGRARSKPKEALPHTNAPGAHRTKDRTVYVNRKVTYDDRTRNPRVRA